MKKAFAFLIIFICVFALVACGEKGTDPANEEVSNEQKIVSMIENYNVNGTNGYDYALEQTRNGIVVNSHTITIRLDNTNETIGSRVEYKKDLNEDITNGQYTEISATAYYKNNRIATYENDVWVWKNCTLSEFSSVNINSFKFNFEVLKDISLTTSGQYNVLSFKVDDSDAASFLGVSTTIKDLTFEIKADIIKERLILFTMSYSQNLTSTRFQFTPYYGSVNVDLPQ